MLLVDILDLPILQCMVMTNSERIKDIGVVVGAGMGGGGGAYAKRLCYRKQRLMPHWHK